MTWGDLRAIIIGSFLGLGISYNLGLILTASQADAVTILVCSCIALALGCMITGALTPIGGTYMGSIVKEPVNGVLTGVLMMLLTNYWLKGAHTIPLNIGMVFLAALAGFFLAGISALIFVAPRKKAYYRRQEKDIKEYDRYIATHPAQECVEAWVRKGNSLYRLGRYAEAAACYEKTLELKPDFEAVKQALEEVRVKCEPPAQAAEQAPEQ